MVHTQNGRNAIYGKIYKLISAFYLSPFPEVVEYMIAPYCEKIRYVFGISDHDRHKQIIIYAQPQ